MERFIEFEVEGQTVRGMFHTPDDRDTFPCVVMLHGFTGNRMEVHFIFVKTARALTKAGIAALRFDFRGSGESDGDFVEMTIPGEIKDAVTAVKFAKQQPSVDENRIGLLGLSMGGCVAACTSAREEVSSLMLWSAVGNPTELLQRRLEDMGNPTPPIDLGGLMLGSKFIETIESVRPLEDVASTNIPVMIIHAEDDTTVPVKDAHDYHDAASKPGRTVHKMILPSGGHRLATCEVERTVIKRTVDWFKETLL